MAPQPAHARLVVGAPHEVVAPAREQVHRRLAGGVEVRVAPAGESSTW
jgi:hypothetical protein